MNEIGENINLKVGLDYLRRDKKMAILISKFGNPDFGSKKDFFQSLLRSIIYQQLSGKSAKAIYDRFNALVHKDSLVTPKKVLKFTFQEMRETGLSFQKIDYLKNLANFFEKNSFKEKDVKKMNNEEISRELTKIKGVGQWTVDMFLMFTLNRLDIMPYGDLGIQKGLKKIFKMNELPCKKKMEEISLIWKPYRTLACWYIWKTVDDDFVW